MICKICDVNETDNTDEIRIKELELELLKLKLKQTNDVSIYG